jgi:nicotinamide-nucleotide amidase
MKAEILSIGDELLIGQTINTNAAWIGMELSLRGVSVVRCTTIPDSATEITAAVDDAMKRADIVFVTGGLGPTEDDITKKVLCTYFKTNLKINEKVLAKIESYFLKKGKKMLDVHVQQAALPVDCKILENSQGTASGMQFEKGEVKLISLPGVPYEMKAIMKEQVLPFLQEEAMHSSIFHQTILLQGIGESELADRMSYWENRIRSEGLGLAYLPSIGILRLRISSYRGVCEKEKIEAYFQELTYELPTHVFGRGEELLSEVVGRLLLQANKTVGTVESCTGGALAHALVNVSGASDYYRGSLLTYSNELKQTLADVRQDDLNEFGAVSEAVVQQMAENGRTKLNADYCISTSGIAGPTGGSAAKPVGTVWIGIASLKGVHCREFIFGDHRGRNIEMTVLTALNWLRCIVLAEDVKN